MSSNTLSNHTGGIDPPTRTSDVETVDLRMAVATACGFGEAFRSRVLESGSNSLAAIYFSKEQLQSIATELRVNYSDNPSKQTLYNRVRTKIGQPQRPHRFRSEDLIELATELGRSPAEFEKYSRLRLQKLQGGLLNGKHLDALIEMSYLDVVLAGDENGRIFWPWRMHAADEVSMPNRDACSYLIVDSVISDDSWGNLKTLNKALAVDADAVVLADVWQNVDETVEQVLDGLETYEQHEWNGDIFIPLQSPVDECLHMLLGAGITPAECKFAVGGLKDARPAEQIKAVRKARDIVGPDPHLHGLGFGGSDKLAAEIAADPTLLDSIDCSTSVQNAVSETEAGEERLSAVAAQAGASLIASLRKFSSCTDSHERTTLGDFQSDM